MKKNKSLLYLSLLFNIVLLFVVYKEERKCHWIQRRIFPTKEDVTMRGDYWCIQGWTNTIEKLDLNCDICFFGHSQIEMSDFRTFFPDKKIVNLGYPGDNVNGMLLRVEQVKLVKPKKVFVMCGVNSLTLSNKEFESKYDQLVCAIQDSVPKAELYIFNILPERDGRMGKASKNARIMERNEFIAQYAQFHKIKLIDVYSIYCDSSGELLEEVSLDGLHIKPNSYGRWAKAIEQYILE